MKERAAVFDHISFGVADPSRSKAFYDAALRPLGIGMVMELHGDEVGGRDHYAYGYLKNEFAACDPRTLNAGRPSLWIGGPKPRGQTMHIAFSASTRLEVDAFHAAALAAGATDHGPPGERAHYHSGYYAAFAIDPDGHNVEVVCRMTAA